MSDKNKIKIEIYKSAPIVLGALFFIFGVVLAVRLYIFPSMNIFFGPSVPTFAIEVILLVILTGIVILIRFKRKIVLLVMVLLIVLGFYMTQMKIENGYGKEGIVDHDSIVGEIVKIEDNGENSISLVLKNVVISGEESDIEINGRASIIVYGQSAVYLENEYFLPKSKVFIETQLMYPAEAADYGYFSERLDMLSQNIFYKALAHYAQIEVIDEVQVPFFHKIFSTMRDQTFGNLQRYVGDDEASFLQAIITGNKSSLSDNVKDDFSRLGVSHLLATSGLHIGILLLAIEYVLKKMRTPIIFRSLLCALAVMIFISFAGFRVSMIRASIMWAMLIISKILGSKISPLNALGAVMLFLLILNPLCIFDISFILSCVSVAAISLLLDGLGRLNKLKRGKKLLDAAFASLAVVLFTWPITAYYFNSISVLSPIYNIIFVPLAGVALFLGMLFGIFSGVSFIAPIVGAMAKAVSFIILSGANFFSDYAPSINLISPPIFIIIIWMFAAALLSGAVLKGKFKARAIISLSLLCLAVVSTIIVQLMAVNQRQIKVYSDGSSSFIYMQDGDENILFLNGDSYIARTAIQKSASKNLDMLIYSGNDAEELIEIITDLEDIEVGRILSAKHIADEINIIDDISINVLDELSYLNCDIELLEFKAKSKTAKTHYAIYILKDNQSIIYLDPISLREGAFEVESFDSVISSRWSKSRAENILNINFDKLYITCFDAKLLNATLELEQRGVKIYNITSATEILFQKEDK